MKKVDRTTKILLNVSRIVSSSLDLDTVADLVLRESSRALKTDHASLFLMDETSGYLILTKARGFTRDEMDNIKLLGSWEVINNQLVRRKRPLCVNDAHNNFIKSFLAVPLKRDDKVIGVLTVSNKHRPGHRFTKEDERLLLTLSNQIATALLNAKLYQRLRNLFVSTVASLTRAVDAKDRYTSGHSERVMKYALNIGKELRLGQEALENLRLSSLLHDVGKIGIKESILLKASRLSHSEKNLINRHPAIGARIVETIDNSNRIVPGILEHHEHFDGTGYPNHLKGREISLEGRVIAVADAFDALTTNRPYRKKYTSKETLFEIERGSSTQFDPKVVKAFMISLSRHPEAWKT